MRRYATTRRPHPLQREGMGLEAALKAERDKLRPLRELADLVVDTTRFSIHDLRRAIQKRWGSSRGRLRAIRVNVISFGFKYGVPREADLADLRFFAQSRFSGKSAPLCAAGTSPWPTTFLPRPRRGNFAPSCWTCCFHVAARHGNRRALQGDHCRGLHRRPPSLCGHGRGPVAGAPAGGLSGLS